MQNKSKTFVIVIVIILLVVASYVAFVRKALKDINSVATEDKISTTDDDAIAAKKRLEFDKTAPAKIVALGTTFTAKKDQTFTIKGDAKDTFMVTSFYNVICPPGEQCFSPGGQDVRYSITASDASGTRRTYKSEIPSDIESMPYTVTVISSDYKTYAKIMIQ
ncbi:MAG: hypothetical protein KBB70_01855 [Candidatus Pacebacteria bacterium]|jgi:hypothetical protein|nr:hypothetical protein [Candidatus Paceibacterota bacterium]